MIDQEKKTLKKTQFFDFPSITHVEINAANHIFTSSCCIAEIFKLTTEDSYKYHRKTDEDHDHCKKIDHTHKKNKYTTHN